MENRLILKFHIIFWLLVILITLPEPLLYIKHPLFLPILTGSASILFQNIFNFYFFYTVLSKYLQRRRNYFKLIVLGIAEITVSGFTVTYLSYYLYTYTFPSTVPLNLSHTDWVIQYIYGVMGIGTLFSMLGLLSRISMYWYENKIRSADTDKQNLENELAMLKAQVNPHFLFNTLNNIKSLINSLPDKAVYSIDKLKGIMLYMLNDSSHETVKLEQEINYIKDYLELEKIRYSNPGYIEFIVNGNYSGLRIPPLIFMPFIENAFKHGNKLKPAPGIIINMSIDLKTINFSVKNHIKENIDSVNKKSGFGLKNIKRRLELLFGKSYELLINTENNEYIVNLNLNLK